MNYPCRATIKSEVKLEKTLTFVLIATKTSWLFPQLKTDIKNLTNCLEQCNWILIYILLHFTVYPSFKEQNLLSPKQFWGQKSPLLLANSFFVPQLVRRTEESISGQCNHQVPSTVNGTRKLAAGQDKEKTQKRHRKDTEKTQKRHKKRQAIFSATKPSLGYKRHPDERIKFFYWFQTSPAEVRPRSQTLPLMSCSPVRAIQNLYFFSTKSLQKIDICPQKMFIWYYNT